MKSLILTGMLTILVPATALAQYSYSAIQNQTIWGENLSIIKRDATLEQCQALCDKSGDACGSFDFNPQTGECAANKVTEKKAYETGGWTHYKRSGGSPALSVVESEKEPEAMTNEKESTTPLGTESEQNVEAEQEAASFEPVAEEGNIPNNAVKIVGVVGEVEIIREGADSLTPEEGGTFSLMDRIYTGLDSQATIQFPDGSRVVVQELTDVKLAAYDFRAASVVTRLHLQAGELDAEVRTRSDLNSDWRITTPTATCSIRGTLMRVAYAEESGETTVGVQEGSVEVAPNNAKSVIVAANQQVTVTENAAGEMVALERPIEFAQNEKPADSSPGESPMSTIIIVIAGLAVLALLFFIFSRR